MLGYIERKLDAITMYRVVLYSLIGVVLYAFILSLFSLISVKPGPLFISILVVPMMAYLAHRVCAAITGAPANTESTYITALIVLLIVTPPMSAVDVGIIALITAGAIVLKYVVVYKHRHIFNPAALALVLAGIAGYPGVEWWVGSRMMLPPVIVAGALVAIKTRRIGLVLTYGALSTAITALYFIDASSLIETITRHFLSWPTVFFATIMLIEPLGLPSTRTRQYLFVFIVSVLSSIPYSIGTLYGTPELALIVGNVFTFVTDLPQRFKLTFMRRVMVGEDTYEYLFRPSASIRHTAGQYMEWTLPHAHPDTRGIRRHFSIVSEPQSPHVSIALRHVQDPLMQSSWKRALEQMDEGDVVYATQRSGDFVLRKNAHSHVWIAGGIGITPFISMIRDARASHVSLPVTLFYCNKTEHDIAFKTEIDAAKEVGVRIIHVLGKAPKKELVHEVGLLTPDIIKKWAPNWDKATFYISGPPGLVAAYEHMLREMGVPRSSRIVTDYFPGLA